MPDFVNNAPLPADNGGLSGPTNETPDATSYRTFAPDNGHGKSRSNAGPTAANKRGIDPNAITMNDSLGLAVPAPQMIPVQ